MVARSLCHGTLSVLLWMVDSLKVVLQNQAEYAAQPATQPSQWLANDCGSLMVASCMISLILQIYNKPSKRANIDYNRDISRIAA